MDEKKGVSLTVGSILGQASTTLESIKSLDVGEMLLEYETLLSLIAMAIIFIFFLAGVFYLVGLRKKQGVVIFQNQDNFHKTG